MKLEIRKHTCPNCFHDLFIDSVQRHTDGETEYLTPGKILDVGLNYNEAKPEFYRSSRQDLIQEIYRLRRENNLKSGTSNRYRRLFK